MELLYGIIGFIAGIILMWLYQKTINKNKISPNEIASRFVPQDTYEDLKTSSITTAQNLATKENLIQQLEKNLEDKSTELKSITEKCEALTTEAASVHKVIEAKDKEINSLQEKVNKGKTLLEDFTLQFQELMSA